MTVTKVSLIESTRGRFDMSRSRARDLILSLFEIITASLADGEPVLISGFGKFSVREKNCRRGRNFATGDHMLLDARRVVVFKCSPMLRDKLNGGH